VTGLPPAPYEIALAPPARRAISAKLPRDVAVAAVEFVTVVLPANPRRVGKPLHVPLEGSWVARLMREWRVLYEIDDDKLEVTVLDIRHRGNAYRLH
jgi:mRNA interferase RelE/StbE